LSGIAYLLCGSAGLVVAARGLRNDRVLALSAPFFVRAMARGIFEDGFRLRAIHLVVAMYRRGGRHRLVDPARCATFPARPQPVRRRTKCRVQTDPCGYGSWGDALTRCGRPGRGTPVGTGGRT